MRKHIPIIFIFLLSVLFFWQFFIKGFLPIPSDTIIGLYHPFRDLYSKDYPRGIPFKNFLITDPVRQQYPWKNLALSSEKKLELPFWNPYSFSGMPLLANFQSGAFYPLNILFLIIPFNFAWSLLIFGAHLLGGLFMYFYLKNLRLNTRASLLGGIVFSFSGFFIAWMEWGTVAYTGLWLPLILLSIDKVVLEIKNRKAFAWSFVYLFSLLSSFFAGHLQIFFYVVVFSSVYFIARWWQYGRDVKILSLYIILGTLFFILSFIQWFPTFQLINLSARDIDQVNNWLKDGWFIPWEHIIQFIVPDFFGNPTTLNYWGVWNYGELVGYIGILPLIMAIFAIFQRRDKKTLFYGILFFVSLIFALPTVFAKIPFWLNIPFISSAQPTRFLFLICFSLSVLSALGFDYFIKDKKKISALPSLIFVGVILSLLWIFIPKEHSAVVKNNLLLPTAIFTSYLLLIIFLIIFPRQKGINIIIYIIIMGVTAFDLLRFAWKFTPFTPAQYLFPQTKSIEFLEKNIGNFRLMSLDSQIFPPNFSIAYRLQSIDGYDPLYLRRYGELIAASERNKPNISLPFGFNRIITPHNYQSKIIDLLGVKYILSLADIHSSKLSKVFQEGETRIYENLEVLPRVFFVNQIEFANNKNEAIRKIFDIKFDQHSVAIIEDPDLKIKNIKNLEIGKAMIVGYSTNEIKIDTDNTGNGFIVFTDTFYPTWKLKIDNVEEKIYRTDYNFRGAIIPKGKHTIIFYNSLL